MAPLRSVVSLLLLGAANAHYVLNYPANLGGDPDDEPNAPCGKVTPDFSKDNVTDFHVGGDSIATQLLHPQAKWLYRATLDITGQSGWTQIYPIVEQDGLNFYCTTGVTVNSSWAGQKGLVGTVADAPDGLLFQCAAVNFVSGNTKPPTTCTNSTGVTGSFVSDSALSTLVSSGGSSNSSSNTTSGGPSSTSPGSTTTSTSKAAAAGLVPPASLPLGGLAWLSVMGLIGAALL